MARANPSPTDKILVESDWLFSFDDEDDDEEEDDGNAEAGPSTSRLSVGESGSQSVPTGQVSGEIMGGEDPKQTSDQPQTTGDPVNATSIGEGVAGKEDGGVSQ
jgi:hypothetical protein